MDPPPVSKAIKNLLGNTLLSSPSPEDQVAVEDVLGGGCLFLPHLLRFVVVVVLPPLALPTFLFSFIILLLLSGKIVGIYFSAWWCNPCRIFTPKLIHAYSNILMNEKFDFEIVFASSDQDQAEFDRYFSEMPWLGISPSSSLPTSLSHSPRSHLLSLALPLSYSLTHSQALPFGDDRKTKLKHRFKVANIPTLVLLDPSGRLITKEAREAIADDPDAFGFPWNPKPFWALMGQTVIDGAGRPVPTTRLRGPYLLFFLSYSSFLPFLLFFPSLLPSFLPTYFLSFVLFLLFFHFFSLSYFLFSPHLFLFFLSFLFFLLLVLFVLVLLTSLLTIPFFRQIPGDLLQRRLVSSLSSFHSHTHHCLSKSETTHVNASFFHPCYFFHFPFSFFLLSFFCPFSSLR
jgi:thiol-disulfide isomerase/thioredoxin